MPLASLAAFTAWWTALAALAAGAWVLARDGRAARGVGWGEGLALALVVAVGVGAAALVPGYSRTYTDEATYMLVASALRDGLGAVGDLGYGKSYGWPALLGVAFALGGRDPDVAVLASRVLGGLTLLLVYAAGAAWGGREGRRAGLAAALLLGLSPVHALYAATAEANVAGVFTLALALLAAGLWRREPAPRHGVLVVTATALACATRPEGVVLAAVLAAAHLRRDRDLALLVAVGALLAGPSLEVYAASHLAGNVDRVAAFGAAEARLHPWVAFLTAPLQPLLAGLAAAGLAAGLRAARGPTLALAAWLLLTLALLSWAGTGALALPDRFVLAPALPAALLAGLAVARALAWAEARSRAAAAALAALGAAGVVAAAWPGLAAARRAHPAYALQHRLPGLVAAALPPGCALVANRPELYRATTDLQVLAAADVLAGAAPLPACAAFAWDLTCTEWRSPPFPERCAALRARAAPTPLATFPAPGPPPVDARGRPAPRDARLLDLSLPPRPRAGGR